MLLFACSLIFILALHPLSLVCSQRHQLQPSTIIHPYPTASFGYENTFTMTPDPHTMHKSSSSSFASTAFNLYTKQRQIEQHKPTLSRMSFVRDAFRVSGSVLPRIFPSVLCLTLYATVIALGDLVWGAKWFASFSLTNTLSVVVGLLLVFRNGTSYDRWYEGRKLWQDASSTVKNLAVMIWVNVDTETDPAKEAWRLGRKKRALRLLVAFLVAVKHELRGERGVGWNDLRGVLPPEWLRDSSSNAIDHDTARKFSRDVEQGGATSSSETSPLLTPPSHDSNEDHRALALPQRILCELHIYLSSLRRSGLLDDLGPAGFSLLNTHLLTLSTLSSSLIRISTTPNPLIYAIHLKQSCLLYLLTLPLALVGELGWKMVPFVSVVSMTLIGLEGISSEIEDPFGGDESDHPLDLWCSRLRWEIELIMKEVPPGVREE